MLGLLVGLVVLVVLGFGVGGLVVRSASRGAAFLADNPIEERQRLQAASDEHDLGAQLAACGLTDQPSEPVELTTADGLRLAGQTFPSNNGAAVIVVHGLKGSGASMLAHATPLIEHGFGVLLLDLRAHGRSDGRRLTHGHLEQHDLLAAYEHLVDRPDVDPGRIGVLGGSMGGSLAILAGLPTPRSGRWWPRAPTPASMPRPSRGSSVSGRLEADSCSCWPSG